MIDPNTTRLIGRLVQLGTVTAVDAANRRARVLLRQSGITSGYLPVLQRLGTEVDITASNNHSHAATAGVWLPNINDTVLVLYLPVDDSDGFILGRV